MVRLVDPIARTAQELSTEAVAALSSGDVVLITRRLAGAGIDPNTFGFRWFWPSILRYRRSLAHVLIASLFVQLFALATPIFFQLIVDKVLVHKGVSTLIVLIVGMVTLGLFETVLQFLRTYTLSHTTNRMDVELAVLLLAASCCCDAPAVSSASAIRSIDLRNCSAAAEACVNPLANSSVAAATRSKTTAAVEVSAFSFRGESFVRGLDFDAATTEGASSDRVAIFELLTSAMWYPSLNTHETRNGDQLSDEEQFLELAP